MSKGGDEALLLRANEERVASYPPALLIRRMSLLEVDAEIAFSRDVVHGKPDGGETGRTVDQACDFVMFGKTQRNAEAISRWAGRGCIAVGGLGAAHHPLGTSWGSIFATKNRDLV